MKRIGFEDLVEKTAVTAVVSRDGQSLLCRGITDAPRRDDEG